MGRDGHPDVIRQSLSNSCEVTSHLDTLFPKVLARTDTRHQENRRGMQRPRRDYDLMTGKQLPTARSARRDTDRFTSSQLNTFDASIGQNDEIRTASHGRVQISHGGGDALVR